MGKVVICYKRFESIYETNDTEISEWTEYSLLSDFEKDHPEYKVIFIFTKEDNLLR